MAPSAEFITEMERLRGALIKPKVELILDGGTFDVSAYYISGGDSDQEKERNADKLSTGDASFIFSNYSNYFSELDSTSILYGVKYHNRKIRVSIGLMLADGSIECVAMGTYKIKKLEINQGNNQVIFYCNDLICKIIDEKLNIYPTGLIPTTTGTGNGIISELATKPFATISENITITFSSDTSFTVVGSISGALGSGTVGTLFTATGNVCRFLISAGETAFINGDIITFSTYQYPQFTDVNIIKIIWALLTGYDYDTDTQLNWGDRASINLDHTQSTANTDLNYADFADAISKISISLTGYVDHNRSAKNVLEELLPLFLGALFVDGDGKIDINVYVPSLGVSPRNFADTKQITKFVFSKDINNLINYCVGGYKKNISWAWSDVEETTDSNYSMGDTLSQTNNLTKISFNFDCVYWYSSTNPLNYLFTRILDRNSIIPQEVEFETWGDGINTKISDVITLTENKTGLNSSGFEIIRLRKNISGIPKTILITATNLSTFNVAWAFCGSDINEGDGISPQAANYDTATITDKQFGYLAGDGTDERICQYYCW